MRLESLLTFCRNGDTSAAEVRVGRDVVCIDVSYEDGSRATVVLDNSDMDRLAEAWLARKAKRDGLDAETPLPALEPRPTLP